MKERDMLETAELSAAVFIVFIVALVLIANLAELLP